MQSEAESIVGYPPSFLNLRWRFNDEIANTVSHLKKLVQPKTKHPLLETAKKLINSKNNLQPIGLITLLVSKAAGFNTEDFTSNKYDSGVLHSQRELAECVEMTRMGLMIHKTMVNLRGKNKRSGKEEFKEFMYGNKIALLSGDYLLATSLRHIPELHNDDVTDIYLSGLRDQIEGDFFGDSDKDNSPLPTQPKGTSVTNHDWESNVEELRLRSQEVHGKDEWKLRTMMQSGSMLGKGCKAAMKLANRGEEMERNAYKLGGHLAFLWQLYLDIKDFINHPYSYSLVGAPLLLALEEHPEIYKYILIYKASGSKDCLYEQLYYAVGEKSLKENLRVFLDKELGAVMKYSEKFPIEDAKSALQKIAMTIHDEALHYID